MSSGVDKIISRSIIKLGDPKSNIPVNPFLEDEKALLRGLDRGLDRLKLKAQSPVNDVVIIKGQEIV